MGSYLDRIVSLFVKKEKRERILALAANPKRRADLHDALLHDTRSLDRRTMLAIDEGVRDAKAVLPLLRAKPSARAYSISTIPELDDREVELGAALERAFGRERDTIVFCIETERAYYENHEGECFVLGPAR